MSIEETLKDPPKPLVIYHGNCADGFTAAWLFNIWYWQEVLRHDGQPNDWCVDGYPGVYGQSPPDVTGRRVYILDFSYPPDTLMPMAIRAASITVIDHHKSAIERLEGFDMGNVKLILDDSRSGAYLTSLYLWPTREPSSMVEYVDDRDRWQFKLKNTRAFNASLFSRPYKIGEWNRLNANVPEAIMEGEAIDRKHFKDIEELLKVCTMMREIDGVEVPVANLPYTLSSDACHIMLVTHPTAPFSACWYMRSDGTKVFSLRSRSGDTVDVSKIAQKYGGGGHMNASGCTVLDWPN